MKFRNIIFTLLAIGLVGFIIYRVSSNSEKEKSQKAPMQKSAASFSGKVLSGSDFASSLTLSGSVEANEQVDIRSEISGIVEAINFEEGKSVKKGQILFRVNDLELRAQLAQIKTAQGLSSENERRAKLLLEKEAISQEEYDIASADFRSAQSRTQLIQAQLAKATVRAPFDGKIGLRYISKGTYVTPMTPIATLVNDSKVKITFSIPEKYASQIKTGDIFSFSTSNNDGKYSAKIYAKEPEIDVATRTLKIRGLSENKDGKLLTGSFASITLPLQIINDALLVPTEVLIPIQNGKKMFIVKDGKAKEVIVQTGSRTAKEILITAGLTAGDTILTSGVMTLQDGMPVRVKL